MNAQAFRICACVILFLVTLSILAYSSFPHEAPADDSPQAAQSIPMSQREVRTLENNAIIQAYLNAADQGRKYYVARYGKIEPAHLSADYPMESLALIQKRSPTTFVPLSRELSTTQLDLSLKQQLTSYDQSAQPLSPALLYLLHQYEQDELKESHELLLLSRLLNL